MLESGKLLPQLKTHTYGRSLDVRATTGSTNDDAREAAASGAPRGHVVVADAQDRGRGSHGRTWSSPPGTDLYLSIVERLVLPPAAIATVTLAVGLGVSDAIGEIAPVLAPRVRVKWPNDAWIDRKKTAGILVESTSSGATQGPIVIGIGLGVNRTSWPEELAGQATSLRDATGAAPFDRHHVLAVLLACVERAVDALATYGVAPTLARLDERLAMKGEEVVVDGLRGTLLGLDDRGGLRLRTTDGERVLLSGTVRPA